MSKTVNVVLLSSGVTQTTITESSSPAYPILKFGGSIVSQSATSITIMFPDAEMRIFEFSEFTNKYGQTSASALAVYFASNNFFSKATAPAIPVVSGATFIPIYTAKENIALNTLTPKSVFGAVEGRLIKANSLAVGDVICYRSSGTSDVNISNSAVSVSSFKLGASTVFTQTNTYQNARAGHYRDTQFDISIRSIGANATAIASGRIISTYGNAPHTADIVPMIQDVPVTFDSTVDNLLDAELSWVVNPNTITLKQCIAYIIQTPR